MHLGPMKLLYYYSNPAKTSPNEPKRSPNDSQRVPMRVLLGAGGVGHALGAN